MVKVLDCIDLCDPGKQVRQRNIDQIEGIAIHRIDPSLGETAAQIAHSFTDTSTKYSAGSYTGGVMPYTFVLPRTSSAQIEQALPIGDVSPHAKRWNLPYIGVACVGDFRFHEPTQWQWDAAQELCAFLVLHFGRDLKVYGHTELDGASADRNKSCPGIYFNMGRFRAALVYAISKAKADALSAAGIMV